MSTLPGWRPFRRFLGLSGGDQMHVIVNAAATNAMFPSAALRRYNFVHA
ncbi:MAG: hypothetical protein ACOYMN_16280 [Roseimicrobium sp.]